MTQVNGISKSPPLFVEDFLVLMLLIFCDKICPKPFLQYTK